MSFDAYGKIMIDFLESYKDLYGVRDHNAPPDELQRLVAAALDADYAAAIDNAASAVALSQALVIAAAILALTPAASGRSSDSTQDSK